MAKNEQQRQKKLAKKRSNEIRKRQEAAREKQQMTSLAGQMQAASNGEVRGCYISDFIFERGMGSVVIGRAVGGDRVAMAFFLIDAYCLGVKDVGAKLLLPGEFRKFVEQFAEREPLKPAEPAAARKLVEGAIAFAGFYGLQPHPDYRKVHPIWGDIDPAESDQEFAFGQGGMPLYIPGPFDDPARQQAILEQIDSANEQRRAQSLVPDAAGHLTASAEESSQG